ncbi:ribosome small subunit-dependent GTPase A [Primorskyibacter aestuariivivens]|uniref:ribosome small subunit-dependent GTPase A n=1 Tax=Primorskyibacter aestuariivivens TaxID=1888912 RepID=UPI0022FFEB4A|nr:ribosome small subunit-dependent GTPase A [Primorskyibacter aestuariivivens]MDA7428696.1 ribosome small subunit-dependent GTPase A [Primorskyibacter aestuariivivens]
MTKFTLSDLGWSDHFASQLEARDATLTPARIAEVHRDRLSVLTEAGEVSLHPRETAGAYAVGDWVLSDGQSALRRLTPTTDVIRRAAGHGVATQRIAANVDTIGIVTSCNEDFNIARLERYLALVSASGALPQVILTKADMCDDPSDYVSRAERLSPLVSAIALNAKDPEDAQRLAPWCSKAQTLALLGSSGVGKTTLRNHLTGETAATQGIRADDAKGRHTTTSRALRPTLTGGWLIDTPGMRELQLSDASEGIGAVFDDIEELATECRFNDCAHDKEPGCAIKAALESGTLDAERLARWQKLRREDSFNSETIAESRARHRSFKRMVNEAKHVARKKRDTER